MAPTRYIKSAAGKICIYDKSFKLDISHATIWMGPDCPNMEDLPQEFFDAIVSTINAAYYEGSKDRKYAVRKAYERFKESFE